jgi:putative N6-adenine-specific DNA methylase
LRLRLIATAAFGLEAVVERELSDLGYQDTLIENGRVFFTGDEQALCRANLWLRAADRVLLQVGSFPARTFDELFQGCRQLPWSDLLPADAGMPVRGRSVKSQLHSVPDCQAIVKKAIVESMKQRYMVERFPETGASFQIEVSLLDDVATITIDASGEALHKRGYRKEASAAPIKETLAAGMVLLSRWAPHRPFLDPFCGSGTIPIEAALIATKSAPGLRRSFASEDWPFVGAGAWKTAREEARDTESTMRMAIDPRSINIEGSDIDGSAITVARQNVQLAGVADLVRLAVRPVREVHASADYGCVVTNPPYGERVGEIREAEKAYSDMRYSFSALDTWSFFVISPHASFERLFGKRVDKKRRLYNGNIACTFFQYLGPLPPRRH